MMMNIHKIAGNLTKAFLIAVSLLLIAACNPSGKYEREEQDMIDTYLANNPGIAFVQKPSGLYYHQLTEGTGNLAVKNDTAYVKYTGKFLDGTIFDTNVGKSDSLKFIVMAGWLIEGFDESITYMKQGGKAIILVPSWLAYGTSGLYGFVSGYTPLMFDIELVRLEKGPGK